MTVVWPPIGIAQDYSIQRPKYPCTAPTHYDGGHGSTGHHPPSTPVSRAPVADTARAGGGGGNRVERLSRCNHQHRGAHVLGGEGARYDRRSAGVRRGRTSRAAPGAAVRFGWRGGTDR